MSNHGQHRMLRGQYLTLRVIAGTEVIRIRPGKGLQPPQLVERKLIVVQKIR